MRIPARHANLLFAAIMSFLMALAMTAIIVAINRGLGAGYVAAWLHSFAIAWPIAFGLVLLLAPRVRGLVARLVTPQA
jgi:hypothetical protein